MKIQHSSFYITTPIYYVNDKPHIGHAYTTILADILARYHRLLGIPTYFLTGTDEHGQKVADAAAKNGIPPIEQCNSMVIRYQELWKKLGITHDHFLRTTEEWHQRIVKQILQKLYDQGEIYKDDYKGFYCVPCERFFTEKDLIDKSCPECKRKVDTITEANYFFRMSAYQEWLIQYIHENPDFIQPPHRRNETLGFLRKPLEDLCISRPKSRLSWGIELPFDPDYVCYVWFDALINYISGINYGKDPRKFHKWWSGSHHLIGKDILTTHTVYWPTMLKAMGIEMPRSIFAHGWWLVGKDKMGKSLGNVVDPMQVCDEYGVDPFRYFLTAEMTLGQDASFTEQAFIERYNTDLADGLGNMLNRVIRLINRHYEGKIPKPGEELEIDKDLRVLSLESVEFMENCIGEMKLDRGLAKVMAVVRGCNQYFERTTPWELVKRGDFNRLGSILYTAVEALQIQSALLFPVLPEKMAKMRRVLGIKANELEPALQDLKTWGKLKPGTKIGDIHSLFPRIDSKAKKMQKQTTHKENTTPPVQAQIPEGAAEVIDISEFGKVQLKTAKVIVAEKVANADRLLRLEVQIGDEIRQIVAGIAAHYTPEKLIGKLIVIVANLKPAKIRGLQSNGMLLAAKDETKLRLITLDGECRSGLDVG